jgi:signal transduction histidine kinase
VARHSGAKQAEVRPLFDPDRLVLEVEDSGVGFGNRRGDGLGLVSMRERSEIVGGSIEFLSGAGGGALVRITVPASLEETRVAAET